MNSRVARVEPLLALIRKNESDGAVKAQKVASSYDVVWSRIRPDDRPQSPISKLPVSRVLWWQDTIDPLYMSEAAGAYQIMEDTLRELLEDGAVSPDRKFDKATQDELALALLDRRGWDDLEAGRITREQFGNELAKEWASLPVITGPRKGKSYYDGDGLNASHTTPAAVLAAIDASLARKPVVVEPAPGGLEEAVVSWVMSTPPGVQEVGKWLSNMPRAA